MFIIDFDDTLFDTYRFKRARVEALDKLGVSEELYWQTYREARNDAGGNFCYSDARHAEMLEKAGFGRVEVLNALQSITLRIKDFLFNEVDNFLKSLRALGQPMVLLSFGEPNFQELKVKGTGVDIYFDRMFMVQDTKEHVIGELLSNVYDDQFWFINDKVDETLELYRKFPNLQIIFKQADEFTEGQYKASGWPYFKNLMEIKNYVIQQIK